MKEMIPFLFERSEKSFIETITFLFENLLNFDEEAISLQVKLQLLLIIL
jgi:hypothetical protein